MQPCQYERVIDMIEKRLDRMDSKLDTLLEDKWKRVGVAATLSLVISITITVIGWAVK